MKKSCVDFKAPSSTLTASSEDESAPAVGVEVIVALLVTLPGRVIELVAVAVTMP